MSILQEIIRCNAVLPLHTLTPPSLPNRLRYHSDSYQKNAGDTPSHLKRLRSEPQHSQESGVLINSLNCRINSNVVLANRDRLPVSIIKSINKIPQREHKYLTYLFTPWSSILLEKLTGSQLVKKSPHLMEPQGSLPHSQVPTTSSYFESARSSPYPHITLPKDAS